MRAFPDHAVRQGLKLYLDWQNSLLDEAAIHRDIFIESPFVHPSVMYRRDAVVRLGGYQEHGWPEDYDLGCVCTSQTLNFLNCRLYFSNGEKGIHD